MSWERHPDPRAWAKRYDELVQDPNHPKRWMGNALFKPSEWQVFDPAWGYFYRRNGEDCCGCGKSENTDGPVSPEAAAGPKPKGLVNWLLGRSGTL
jgi:hypothetical protein